ncbi:MAG: winged helix-turn-helix transcriptional regulator, partial [Clostridia bacterium]|nr:winged helix-turn-helix transcriptional regulator [Clostridia bacterium]
KEELAFEAVEHMRRLYRRLLRELQEAFRSEGLSPMELGVLWALKDGRPHRMTDVADRTGILPNTLSGIVDRLEAAGLVERRRSERDRRAIELHATPALRERAEAIGRSLRAYVLPWFSALPEEDLAHLVRVLRNLAEVAEGESR